MEIIRNVTDMREWSRAQRWAGRSLGLTPTMGALHAGHRSLMEASAAENDRSVVSIFVNPAQFAPHEDFDQYPRTFEADLAMAKETGMDAVYAPDTRSMYPAGYGSYVEVERLQEGLCGISRPHFFRGVATVVAKLFHAVEPDRAYFGQKDAQQCAIIKRMVKDLDFGIEIVEMPIVREADGLAMSSRNVYLDAGERQRALALSRALFDARDRIARGERDAARLEAAVRDGLAAEVDVDYVTLVNAENLTPLERIEGNVLLAVAAKVGATRLIDNVKLVVPVEVSEDVDYDVQEQDSSRNRHASRA